ncbi:MAG: hypothetical protein ACE14W_10425 [Candidatus Velamenicoccus archaeovorus]
MSTTKDRARAGPATALPTDPEPPSFRQLRRARAGRRLTVGVLTLFVLAGLAGVFGYRTGEAVASGGGYELRLSYPRVSRPGLPIQWILHVHRDGGLPPKLTLATSVGYLELLDVNDLQPQPDASATTGTSAVWTFATTGGEDMTIALDAIVSPSAHRGASAVTAVLEGGQPVVRLRYGTTVMP